MKTKLENRLTLLPRQPHFQRVLLRKLVKNVRKSEDLGLSVTKFKYGVILTSQLLISSLILFSMVDFTHFLTVPNFSTLGLQTKE